MTNSRLQTIFCDKKGRVVLFQRPNVPLAVWLVGSIIAHLVSDATLQADLQRFAQIALSIWAYLEIAYGVTYFRRLLGGVVLAWIVATLFII